MLAVLDLPMLAFVIYGHALFTAGWLRELQSWVAVLHKMVRRIWHQEDEHLEIEIM